jgi:hypothetical protein
LQEKVECGLEFVARFEDFPSPEDIQTQSCTGESDSQTTDVAQVSDAASSGERKDYV